MRGTVGLLVPMLVRTRTFRRGMLPLLLAVLLGWATALLTSSVTASPQQVATQALGSADGTTPWPTSLAPAEEDPVLPPVEGLQDVVVQKFTGLTWVRPDGQPWESVYLEEPMPSFLQEGRLELVTGRWPTDAGEVVVTAQTGLAPGQVLNAKVGRLEVDVVGVVSDVYAQDSVLVYGAPGTWAQWQIPADQVDLVYASAQVMTYWTSTDPFATATALDQALGAPAGQEWSTTADKLIDRSSGASSKRWLEVGVPVLVTVAIGAWISGSLIGRYSRRITDPLGKIGLDVRSLRRSTLTSFILGTTVGLVLAYAGVLGLLALTRPLLAARLDHPLSPWSWSTTELLASLILPWLVGPVAITMTAAPRHARPSRVRALGNRLTPLLAGGTAGVCLAGAAAFVVTPRPTFTSLLVLALLLTLAAALLSLAVLPLLSQPGRDVDHKLAARRMLSSRRATLGTGAAAITALTTLVALIVGVAGGTIAQLNHISGTGIPPGMALLHTDLAGSAQAEVQASFEQYVGTTTPPVPFGVGAQGGPDAEDDPVPTLVLQSEQDVVSVFGDLSPEQRDLLTTSGLPTHPEGAARTNQPALTIPWDMRWLEEIQVVTGQNPSWVEGSGLLYFGLTPAQDRDAGTWAEAHGYSSSLVQTTSGGGELGIPLRTQLITAGFGLITLLVSALWLRGELASWRPLLATLRAIGLGQGWVSRLAQHLGSRLGLTITLTSAGVVLAGVILAQRLLGGALRLQGVPWLAVVLLLLCGAVGTWLGATMAARNITPRERRA